MPPTKYGKVSFTKWHVNSLFMHSRIIFLNYCCCCVVLLLWCCLCRHFLPVLFHFLKTAICGLFTQTQLTSSQTSQKSVKRPPTLIIPPHPKQQLSPPEITNVPTTITEASCVTNGLHSKEKVSNKSCPMDSGLLRKRVRNERPVSIGNGESKKSLMDEGRKASFLSSGSFDRRMSTPTSTLNLTYNRSCMKRPSVGMSYADQSPSPTEENLVLGEDSYTPKIAEHTKSWPSFMARNYFRLNNIKLFNTFLINIILLMFQVEVVCFV